MVKNLRILRTKCGISQQQLADVIGVSQQSINKYENHDTEPDIETLKKIALYFNTSIDFLVGFNDTQKDESNLEILKLFGGMSNDLKKVYLEQGKNLYFSDINKKS